MATELHAWCMLAVVSASQQCHWSMPSSRWIHPWCFYIITLWSSKSSSIIPRSWSSIWCWWAISTGLVRNNWLGAREESKGDMIEREPSWKWTLAREEPSLTNHIMNCVWLAGVHHLMMMLREKWKRVMYDPTAHALDPKPWPFVGYRTKVAGLPCLYGKEGRKAWHNLPWFPCWWAAITVAHLWPLMLVNLLLKGEERICISVKCELCCRPTRGEGWLDTPTVPFFERTIRTPTKRQLHSHMDSKPRLQLFLFSTSLNFFFIFFVMLLPALKSLWISNRYGHASAS